MSMAHDSGILPRPDMASLHKAMRATSQAGARTYCSTVDADETAQVPERLQTLWDAWHVVSNAPDSRAARVEAARLALRDGTLCLDPHVLAERLLHQTIALRSDVTSAKMRPHTRLP